MAKRYVRINWQNSPSVGTALGATNLNKMDVAINDIDNALIVAEDKLDTASAGVDSIKGKQEELASTFSALTINAGSSNAEIVLARGDSSDLPTRLDTNDALVGEIKILSESNALQLEQITINVKLYGAKGDGITNDTQAFVNALATGNNVFVPSGTYILDNIVFPYENVKLYGLREKTILSFSNTVGAKLKPIANCQIDGFIIKTLGASSIVQVSYDNIALSNLHFIDCNASCILIAGANYLDVLYCTFEQSSYGVIQQYGYSSNNVRVHGCNGINIQNDMIEANCGKSVSYNWIITDNTCIGSASYDSLIAYDVLGLYKAAEERFCGITGVRNVLISNNIVKNLGHSAVSLEDIGGKVVISNNIFENCFSEGIIVLQGDFSTKSMYHDVVITGNQITNTNPFSATKFIFSYVQTDDVNNYLYGHLLISNNMFEGHPNLNNPISLNNHAKTIINGNTFKNIGIYHKITTTLTNEYKHINQLTFTNNFVSCNKFIDGISVANSGSITNLIMDNNKIISNSGVAVIIDNSYFGTQTITNIDMSHNEVFGKITIKNGTNIKVIANKLSEEMDIGMTNTYMGLIYVDFNTVGAGVFKDKSTFSAYNNTLSGTTAQRPTINYKGQKYLDITIVKPIYWNGTVWVDAIGTVV